MKIKLFAVFVLALIGIPGLSVSDETKQPGEVATNTPPPSPDVQTTKQEGKDRLTVIGYLESRDRIITIKSGSKGTAYTVATKDGKVLHENLSAEQLKAQLPELHELIANNNSGDARLRPIVIDASVRF